MDLDRMQSMCERGQWKLEELDFSRPPRRFSPEDEERVVQYFTDMAGIERIAGDLFRTQRDRARDPRLRAIFQSFVEDEERHAIAAEKLARHFDVRKLRVYAPNPHLVAFHRSFVRVLEHVSPEIANGYIITGELLLDVALLRSLDDFVDDATCHQAMVRINRDESRHIAMDYFMVEYYASAEHRAYEATLPRKSPRELLEAALAFSSFAKHAQPFFKAVFFEPMDMVDPSGRRLREAFKRVQLLGEKDEVRDRPFPRLVRSMQLVARHPLTRPLLGRAATRALGLDPRVMDKLYDDAEAAWAKRASIEEMANEALSSKALN